MAKPISSQDPEKGVEPLNEEEVRSELLPPPPDGGWGWIVVFASFMIHVFADGFTYTFGIFYVHILDYYGVSKSAASWIASILVGVTLGSGPISGTLVNHFGCRVVTIMGAILASISILLSVFAQSVVFLYLTIGFGAGLGFGLIYLPAIVCVTGYFEKKRSFATGIAVCGSGLGTFIFSPLTEHLIEIYNWKGAIVIIAGMMLNCVFFGSLFRPLELEVKSPTQSKEELTPKENHNGGAIYTSSGNNVHPTDSTNIPQNKQGMNSIINHVKYTVSRASSNKNIPRNSSHSCLDARLKQLKAEETGTNGGDHRLFSSQPLLPQSQKTGQNSLESRGSSFNRKRSHSGLLNRRDIFYGGSLLNIEQYKQDPDSYRSSIIRTPDLEETPSEKERMKICGCIPCSKETRQTFFSLMNWELLSDRIFLLFILSNFCTSIGFNAPYVFVVDRALELGIDSEKASYLLSVIGIANTVSRVVLGYISDKPWVNRLHLYNLSLTLCGLGTCLSIWFPDFISQTFYVALFGSTSGAYVGLTSVVLVDLLGMEKLTNAFGVLLMFQGIASLIGPPICGALYEVTKSYDYSFLMAGFMIAVSGLMLFFLPCAQNSQKQREMEKIARQYNKN